MIRMTMKRYDRTVELKLPTAYEHVLVALWRLGLDRDPVKYTLIELNAVFHYDTPQEHQMIRTIDSGNTLMFALRSLHEMIAPPYPVADKLRKKIAEGCYNTADDYYLDMEGMVFGKPMCHTSFYFPISGELVDAKGNVKKAPVELLVSYKRMIAEAMGRVRSSSLFWETELFFDVEGAYQKMLAATWMIENIGGMLVGEVSLTHTEPFTEDELADLNDKIEMINSVDFAIRIKQWSVLTDKGLLFIYLCDEDGDYTLYSVDEADEDEELCMCPDCRERMRKRTTDLGTVLPKEELEELREGP